MSWNSVFRYVWITRMNKIQCTWRIKRYIYHHTVQIVQYTIRKIICLHTSNFTSSNKLSSIKQNSSSFLSIGVRRFLRIWEISSIIPSQRRQVSYRHPYHNPTCILRSTYNNGPRRIGVIQPRRIQSNSTSITPYLVTRVNAWNSTDLMRRWISKSALRFHSVTYRVQPGKGAHVTWHALGSRQAGRPLWATNPAARCVFPGKREPRA